jgi:hypothetical protein
MALGPIGCATPPANSGHSSFSGYAESVFRHQNDVGSRLMMLNDADQLPDDEEFQSAEEAMANACHLLNEYAERESNGDSMGWRFKSKVQDSIKDCDASVKRMETLMAKPEMMPKP